MHGVADVSQSEFLSLCQHVEAQGIFSLKKTRADARSAKVCQHYDHYLFSVSNSRSCLLLLRDQSKVTSNYGFKTFVKE